MYDLTQFSLRDMLDCGFAVRQISRNADNMTDASNQITQYLYQNLINQKTGEKLCSLVHFFKTHSYGELPPNLQKYARKCLRNEQLSPQLKCLTLLSSAGEDPIENPYSDSLREQVIPLESQEAITRIPIISQLIHKQGIDPAVILKSTPNLRRDIDPKFYNLFEKKNFLIQSNIQSVIGSLDLLPSGNIFITLIFLKVNVSEEMLDSIRSMALNIKTGILAFDESSVFSVPPTSSMTCKVATTPDKDQIIEGLKSQVKTLNQLLDISEQSTLIELDHLEKVIANQQTTINQIKSTQNQVIQAEKMSSLGQIVAGVSHEINNPISFIAGNIFHLQNYIQDLLKVLKLYQDKYPEPPEDLRTEIAAIDLDFVKEDSHQILKSMRQGSQRISRIVKTLQNFVRSDEAQIKLVDIHQGIDSAIDLLQNRLVSRYNLAEIKIIKDYGNLPKIECYPGEINQVFMNIMSNAIDALAASNNDSESSRIKNSTAWLKIQTKINSENQILICISDNGCGMSEEVRAKIFDPFFTTKPVGSGTGLGLSASYQIIVEKHHGKLSCYSTPGQGTKFMIEIPTQQQIFAVA